jgi:hypothetical protein
MKTLILSGEIGHDGKLRVELPEDIRPGPVEVTVRPLPISEPARADWFGDLLNARERMNSAGCYFMNDAEVEAYVEELREDDSRIAAAYRHSADLVSPDGKEDDARLPG